MKALIVDDDVYVRLCITSMIPWQDLGFAEVLEADNGATALDIALNEMPDLIVSDVKMPVLGGLELSQKLRDSMVDICVIILSEYSDFEFIQKAMNCGVKDYILKPITRARLEEMTKRIRQLMRELEKQRYYTSLITDKAYMQGLVHDMMAKSDAQACLELLESEVLKNIHIDDLKRFCLMLIAELFAQMEAGTFRKAELEELKNASLSKFAELKNTADILAFTKDAFSRLINFECKQVSATENYVQRICDYIEENYADPDLSVAKIAAYMWLSPVYTGALYKKHQGDSLISRIHAVRLRHAKELLEDMTLSISDVSVRVGYLTPDYFTRVFHRLAGMTPSEYQYMLLKRKGR